MDIPNLEWSTTCYAVEENRKKIQEARERIKVFEKVLNGLELANQGLCQHAGRKPHYDIEGQDGFRCDDCGKRGYF